jgi:hypothetical protein
MTIVSEVLTASIIRAMNLMMEAPLKHQSISNKLHSATSHKTVISANNNFLKSLIINEII